MLLIVSPGLSFCQQLKKTEIAGRKMYQSIKVAVFLIDTVVLCGLVGNRFTFKSGELLQTLMATDVTHDHKFRQFLLKFCQTLFLSYLMYQTSCTAFLFIKNLQFPRDLKVILVLLRDHRIRNYSVLHIIANISKDEIFLYFMKYGCNVFWKYP